MGIFYEKTAHRNAIPDCRYGSECRATDAQYRSWCLGRRASSSRVRRETQPDERRNITSGQPCLVCSRKQTTRRFRASYRHIAHVPSIHRQTLGSPSETEKATGIKP